MPYQSHTWEPMPGDAVENTNPGCKHFGSRGFVVSIQDLDADAGKTITYQCTNLGPSWDMGTRLTKTMDQLSPLGEYLGEGMLWHIRENVSLDTPVYRPGTENYFELFRQARSLYRAGAYEPLSESEEDLLQSDLGDLATFEGHTVPLDFPMGYISISEAKYKGKEVELGKPKKGEGGKAYVYVRDPKTGNVKKVSFGSSMPDAMGDSDAARKRRKSFGDRHNCSDKDDRTKAGYWACRSTKFFGRDIPGWW
jgi:hypothetical protein